MLKIANNTEYGLTGAVITNTREHWHIACRKFNVGNLYLNRGCTAAVVGYHPFGGFKMSGTDQKTGSPDYLLNSSSRILLFFLHVWKQCHMT